MICLENQGDRFSSIRTEGTSQGGKTFGQITPRIPLSASIDPSWGHRDMKLKVREVVLGTEEIDLAAVEQTDSRERALESDRPNRG